MKKLTYAQVLRLSVRGERLYAREYKDHLDIKRMSWVCKYKPVMSNVLCFAVLHYAVHFTAEGVTLTAARITPLKWSKNPSCIRHPDLVSSWIAKKEILESPSSSANLILAANLVCSALVINNQGDEINGKEVAHIIEYLYKCK